LDLKKYAADIAYTIDGGEIGEVDVESFNADVGTISVEGRVVFPGYGKGVYINAIQVLSKIITEMEDGLWPQNAAGRDPIWWVKSLEGSVAKAEAAVHIRAFELGEVENQKRTIAAIVEKVQKDFPAAKIEVSFKELYKNYKYELDKDPRVVAYAEEGMRRIGIEPKRNIIRGGCDACHMCFSGLPSTNIFVGFQNMHGLTEWITVEAIEASLKTVVSVAQVWVDKSAN